jgi:hypothetical protein
MSSSKPGAQSVSVLPEELRPQHRVIEMGLQELSRTVAWRSCPPYIKRILTSYLTEDNRDIVAAVRRYRVGWSDEKIEADAERIAQDPLVVRVLELQRGVISQ